MTAALHVTAAGRTHTGHVRRRNEDSFYVGEYLYVVADGLGGHVGGDLASRTVIDAVKRHDKWVEPADMTGVLGRAVWDADNAIRRTVRADPALAGMASTLVALLRSGDTAVLANIGDSRAYRMPKQNAGYGPMTQVTEDHVYERLVACGDEVPNLPEMLSRFLDGRKDGRSPDLTILHLHPGERLLLCSDGLSSYVPEERIRTVLGTSSPPSQVAADLVNAALKYGGKDNVTVVVVEAGA
jgi:serine/threonine protein phosphatase PrpC